MRSAQFGVYDKVLATIRSKAEEPSYSFLKDKLFGVFEPGIILAGVCGGISRGVIEGPLEYIKVRRQVQHRWKFAELFDGFGATILRNSFLFGSFVVYIDLSKQLIPGGMGAFLTGAICSNLAWLTIWPIDVAKSQIQSGNYKGKSFGYLIADAYRTGLIFRGLIPGLMRSTVANGCSMVAYKETEKFLKTLHTSPCDL
jgi:solute carrier family 25 carnitine/acylcarnitine transporter 20/29